MVAESLIITLTGLAFAIGAFLIIKKVMFDIR